MLVRSEPQCPADRARLGDYAVARNHADRSQPMLNAVMDTRFEPVHRTWKSLWTSEQRAEEALERHIVVLREAETELAEAFDALLAHLMAQDPDSRRWLTPFLPPDVLAPTAKRRGMAATALTPLLHALPDVRERPIPEGLEARFRQAYHRALACHNDLKAARRSLNEARAERSAAGESWDEAYLMYHVTVEFVARSDPEGIRHWILPWPPAPPDDGQLGMTRD